MSTTLPPDSPKALYHAVPSHALETDDVQDDITLAEDPVELPHEIPPEGLDGRVKAIHFILGCAVLLPWNVVITAMPYFLSRLAGSPIRKSFGSYCTTIFTISNFAFLAHATLSSKRTRPSSRTRTTILWLLFLNALLTLSTFFIPTPGLFAVFVLFNGAAQAAAGGYFQTSLIAVASLFGPGAVQAMISGQAAVAVAVSGVQLISAVSSVARKPDLVAGDGSAEESAAFVFFALSTIFLAVSYLSHEYLLRMPVYDRVAGSLERGAQKISLGSDEGPSRRRSLSLSLVRPEAVEEASNVLKVAKANLPYEIAVSFVFLITLSVFPPITLSVSSVNPTTHPLIFASLHFLVFNVGDFLGRWLCSFRFLLVWSAKRLLVFSFARVLFIPLFLSCNIKLGSSESTGPPLINSDFIFMFLTFFLGWTNGYVSSLCMMAAPSVEHNPRLKGRMADVDVAATVASFCLVAGLALGSISSFAVQAAICKCNPFTS